MNINFNNIRQFFINYIGSNTYITGILLWVLNKLIIVIIALVAAKIFWKIFNFDTVTYHQSIVSVVQDKDGITSFRKLIIDRVPFGIYSAPVITPAADDQAKIERQYKIEEHVKLVAVYNTSPQNSFAILLVDNKQGAYRIQDEIINQYVLNDMTNNSVILYNKENDIKSEVYILDKQQDLSTTANSSNNNSANNNQQNITSDNVNQLANDYFKK